MSADVETGEDLQRRAHVVRAGVRQHGLARIGQRVFRVPVIDQAEMR